MLTQLDAAVKNLRATAEQSCTDWKRVADVSAGARVAIVDDGDRLRDGTVLHVADDFVAIDANGEAVTLKREQLKAIDISLSGSFAYDLDVAHARLVGSDVLVYRRR